VASVTISRSRELVAAMRDATEAIRTRVSDLVVDAAVGVVVDHRAQMPRSGATTRPFRDTPLADRVVARALSEMRVVVASEAPHLHLVELGTTARSYRSTVRGVPHATGRMPTLGPIFIPLAIARRATFLRAAESLLGDREF